MSCRPLISLVQVVLCRVWNPLGFFWMILRVVDGIGMGWCPQPSGQGSWIGGDGVLTSGTT